MIQEEDKNGELKDKKDEMNSPTDPPTKTGVRRRAARIMTLSMKAKNENYTKDDKFRGIGLELHF